MATVTGSDPQAGRLLGVPNAYSVLLAVLAAGSGRWYISPSSVCMRYHHGDAAVCRLRTGQLLVVHCPRVRLTARAARLMLVRVDVDVLTRNNVTTSGRPDGQPMVFAHGYGCDQNMWRFVVPAFEDRYRTVLFDFVGAGGSDLSAYDPQRYGTLDGYATDVINVMQALDLHDVIFVGHSVSAMIGVLAAVREPTGSTPW